MQIFNVEKYRKIIFYGCIITAFVMILAYNILTPYLSDDLSYKVEAVSAGSLRDLIIQQYQEYIGHNGRVIGQFFLRLSLIGSKMIFNMVNSVMFVLLAVLIYCNISGRKKYDIYLFLLIAGMLWRYCVEFGQTVLWLCGACNYLWGSVIILGFVTFYRSRLRSQETDYGVGTAIICLLYGVVAGWCNENTSGGGFLLILIFTILACMQRKKTGKKIILLYMVTAHAGMLGGILGMILSPGAASRAAAMRAEENFTGLVGYLSRFYKCCMAVRELFFELFCIFIIVTIIAMICRKSKKLICTKSMPYLCAALATSFILIIIPPPMERAYFGAGIFLILACLQSFVYAFYGENENPEVRRCYQAGRYIVLSVLCLWLFFTYMENLINLARIYREENERVELIQKAVADGESSVIVPQYREAFENRYSIAHASDMTEDHKYWINHFYENYYSISAVIAIPREEWNELYEQEK